jgi:diadenosine tetraphosphate (Ap4A) HIT family hydrolase
MAFALHPQLTADTIEVTRLTVSAVRLMNDRTWPWLVLVPEREDATELIDLDAADRRIVIEEIAIASTVLRDLFQPDKLNVAALGNQVGQLHVHVIARRFHDPAWPRPVWGTHPPVPYAAHDRETTVAAVRDAFAATLPRFDLPPATGSDEQAEPSGFLSLLGFTDR